jgi:hypothetical protein
MNYETKINGLEISLDTDMDGSGDNSSDRVTGCFLIKGDYSGSLDLALSIGGLEDSEGNFLEIGQSTIEKIEQWALSKGY